MRVDKERKDESRKRNKETMRLDKTKERNDESRQRKKERKKR